MRLYGVPTPGNGVWCRPEATILLDIQNVRPGTKVRKKLRGGMGGKSDLGGAYIREGKSKEKGRRLPREKGGAA